MFEKGEIVYIRDVDGCIYEGKILDIDYVHDSYYVGCDTGIAYKEMWEPFSKLLLVFSYVHKNAAFIF